MLQGGSMRAGNASVVGAHGLAAPGQASRCARTQSARYVS